jgi:hypothetical protein
MVYMNCKSDAHIQYFDICRYVIIRLIKSSRMGWVGHVARMGERGGYHMVVMEELEGKRPLARPRRGYGNNIKMIFARNAMGKHGLDICLRIGTCGGLL